MKNHWNDKDANAAVDRLGPEIGPELALRLYSAQLIGRESDLVLHGGGNVSVKCDVRDVFGDMVPAIHVKASGTDMVTLAPSDMPALQLASLTRFRKLNSLSDADMVNAFRTSLFDGDAPLPSIETMLHAFLPHRYVDHSHADAILALTNQRDPASLLREALGDRVAVIPYVRPGFELAKAAAEALEAMPNADGIVLLQHGLVTCGDDARTSYDRHIEIVTACENLLADRCADRKLTVSFTCDQPAEVLAARAAPILRGLLAEKTGDEDRPHRPSILEWRTTDGIAAFVNSEEAEVLAPTPALTGDHLLHTKPWPLFVPRPAWQDEDKLKRQLESAVADFRRKYEKYVVKHGGSGEGLETAPRVVLLPGAGAFCWGPSKRLARVTADINEHTLAVKTAAHLAGSYQGLSERHLYDMEFRDLQRRKLSASHTKPLAGQVVMISGGAGAIGVAVADCCAAAGAHVALADLDEPRLRHAVETLEERYGEGIARGVHMDVTDEASVRDGYDSVVRYFGGVDVVVPNAGIAHVSPIESLSLADFRRVLDVNAVGYLLFMREGIRILKPQGLGGHIIINASKNVFGPGKDFGAYSASKAAGHQLGKVAAIELAPYGIRVNMINADAVFGDEETPSGLWATIGPDRAKSRNLETKDLPDYYRQRNLLRARVLGRHVGNAVLFFASNATPTTGATLPVDGGVVEAFPR